MATQPNAPVSDDAAPATTLTDAEIVAKIDAMVGQPAVPEPVVIASNDQAATATDATTPPAAGAAPASPPAETPPAPPAAGTEPPAAATPAAGIEGDTNGDGQLSPEEKAALGKGEKTPMQEMMGMFSQMGELGAIVMILAMFNPQFMNALMGKDQQQDPNNPQLTPDQQQQFIAKMGELANTVNGRSEQLTAAATDNKDEKGEDFLHAGSEIGTGEGQYRPRVGNFAIIKDDAGKDLAVLVTGYIPETNEVNYMLGTASDGKPIMGVMKADEITNIVDSQGLGKANPQALRDAVGLPDSGVEGPAQGQGTPAPGEPDREAAVPGDPAMREALAKALAGGAVGSYNPEMASRGEDPVGNRIGSGGKLKVAGADLGGIY